MAQLLKAAGRGDLEKVIELKDKWDFQNKKGETVLHIAVADGELEIVEYLVNHGINVNVYQKKNKFTPAMLCLAQQPPQYLDMFELLLKAKPKMDAKDSSGQTLLHLAAQYEDEEAMELILRHKPTVDVKDSKGMTALHIASARANEEIMSLLIDRGRANVNVVDSKGNSALYSLHWACIQNSETLERALAILISKGAKPLANEDGDTPLHLEARHGEDGSWPTPAAHQLMKAYPDLGNKKNKKNMTAQQLFEQEESEDEDDEEAAKEREKEEEQERIEANKANARAAAIAHFKKKEEAKLEEIEEAEQQSNTNWWIGVAIVVLAIILSIVFQEPSVEN